MDLLGKSLTELLELLRKKKISQQEVFDYFVERIIKYDRNLNAFLTRVKIRSVLSKDGPLAGIPLAIKDNFCTKGVRTTAASKVLDDFIPPYESTVTKRLWDAGAVLAGKTNMDAWAHGASTETSDYGTTKNPYDLGRVAGGSSGGSAAAVAAGLAPAAIGSETSGSIRQPSAWCGTVGLKPSYGRISRYGLIAMGSSWDCPGPITGCVEDAALFMQVLSGKDPFDATSSDIQVDNYLKNLKNKNAYTIGVADKYFEDADTDIEDLVHRCIGVLSKMGHNTKRVTLLDPKYAISVYTILQRSEVSSNLSRYDGIRYGNSRRFFGEEAERRIMLGTYALSHGYYDEYYKKAQKVRMLIAEDFRKVFESVDFVIAPTTPMTALTIGESAKYPFFGELMDVLLESASAAGIPAINLPVGFDKKGLPVGLQIMASHFDEARLLNIAYQLEQEIAFDRRKIMKGKWA